MTALITDYYGAEWERQPGANRWWGGVWNTFAYGGSPFAIGLDLGQARDRSALVVVEHVNKLPPGVDPEVFWADAEKGFPLPTAVREFHVRHLQRWEVGTPYDVVVADVADLTRTSQLGGARLVFDRSGVGRAVGDMVWQAWNAGSMGCQAPTGVTMVGTGGGGDTASKRDLLGQLQLALQQGRFRIPRGIALGDVLEREFASFRLRISRNGSDSIEAQRRAGEGHGDLVIAAALAVWLHPDQGIRPTPMFSDRAPASSASTNQ